MNDGVTILGSESCEATGSFIYKKGLDQLKSTHNLLAWQEAGDTSMRESDRQLNSFPSTIIFLKPLFFCGRAMRIIFSKVQKRYPALNWYRVDYDFFYFYLKIQLFNNQSLKSFFVKLKIDFRNYKGYLYICKT